MKTLIQLQSEASEAILSLRENGKRAMGYKLTFLNKSGRGLAAIRKDYVRAVIALGFSEPQALDQWQDIKDYAQLVFASEE